MTAAERRLVNEAPTVVGLLTSVVESGGSLDLAARAVASEGPPASRALFGRAVRRADTKGSRSVSDALVSELEGVSGEASGYRQAVMLCVSASDAETKEERLRILGDASEVALDAVRLMGERYSASLNTPCMTVFALGIMAPMLLMTILPMLSISELFGTVAIDGDLVMAVILVVVPAVILLMAWRIREGNPFIARDGGRPGVAPFLFLLLSVPLALALYVLGRSAEEAIFLAVVVASVSGAIVLRDGVREEAARAEEERGLRDSVFEIGNSLLGGGGLEESCAGAFASRKECQRIGVALGRELDLCRGDVRSAFERAVSPTSRTVARTLCDIHGCYTVDPDDAGRLAVAVGRQYQNESNTRRELSVRLKSMTDMMFGTAVLFAPMVLGLSVAMLGPLSDISGYEGLEGSQAAVSVYLVELCLIISLLVSSLGEGDGARSTVWRFCLMAPISLIVFALCCAVQLRRHYTRCGGCEGMEFRRRVLWLAVAASGIFVALVILAPYMAPYGQFRHLDGVAGVIDGGWEGGGAASVMYAIGDLFCHQEYDRSYVLNGSQLPFCIRDLGILIGLPLGFLACLALRGRITDRPVPWIGAAMIGVTALEWCIETLFGLDAQVPRLLSGVCTGFGASLFLGWLLYREQEDQGYDG